MALTVENFRIRFPQFSDVEAYPNPVIELFLDEAASEMDEGAWGRYYDNAQGNLAAHKITTAYGAADKGGAVSGAITSINIPNEISISYAAPSGDGAIAPGTTSYLQEYHRLARLALGTSARFISM